jgi:hypothetical protein
MERRIASRDALRTLCERAGQEASAAGLRAASADAATRAEAVAQLLEFCVTYDSAPVAMETRARSDAFTAMELSALAELAF